MLNASAVRSVTFYVAAGPVETCDRCSTAIRNVFLVTYRDGITEKYGSECINRIMAAAPTLLALFQKNAKLLRKMKEYHAILSGPVEAMPRGSEYFGSGLYFIADSKGKDIYFKQHWLFHPLMDEAKNAAGKNYRNEPVAFAAKCQKDIAADLPKIAAEIERLEAFLAKILRSIKPEDAAKLAE